MSAYKSSPNVFICIRGGRDSFWHWLLFSFVQECQRFRNSLLASFLLPSFPTLVGRMHWLDDELPLGIASRFLRPWCYRWREMDPFILQRVYPVLSKDRRCLRHPIHCSFFCFRSFIQVYFVALVQFFNCTPYGRSFLLNKLTQSLNLFQQLLNLRSDIASLVTITITTAYSRYLKIFDLLILGLSLYIVSAQVFIVEKANMNHT